jgi:hypothetical protein
VGQVVLLVVLFALPVVVFSQVTLFTASSPLAQCGVLVVAVVVFAHFTKSWPSGHLLLVHLLLSKW